MHVLKRKIAQVSAAAAVVGASLLGAALPASAVQVGDGLSCTTGSAGSFPSYYGWGTCTGTGKWLLRVSCSWGFTYDSPVVLNFNDTQSISYGSCNWGVSSVTAVAVRD